MRRFVTLLLVLALLLGCFAGLSVTAAAENEIILDTESDATNPDSVGVNQTYTFTQKGSSSYTDKTKVKVEWTVNSIAAQYTSALTWNPETLKWDQVKTVVDGTTESTASFKLTNYSSLRVKGTVVFAAANDTMNGIIATPTGVTATTADDKVVYENNEVTIATPVKKDESLEAYESSVFTTSTITAKLTLDSTELAKQEKQEDNALLGTYTVTVEKVSPYTLTIKKENVSYGGVPLKKDEVIEFTDKITFVINNKTLTVNTKDYVANGEWMRTGVGGDSMYSNGTYEVKSSTTVTVLNME